MMATRRLFLSQTRQKARTLQGEVIKRQRSAAVTVDDVEHITFSRQTAASTVRSFEEIPGPRGLPILGSFLDYTHYGPYRIDKLLDAVIDRFRTYGSIYKETLDLPMANVIDPQDVETLFNIGGSTPIRSPLEPIKHYRELKKRPVGLVHLQGQEWKEIRQIANKIVMRPKSVQNFIPGCNGVTEDFIELMKTRMDENNEVPNYQVELYKWALECTSNFVLGSRMGCLAPSVQPGSEAHRLISNILDFHTGSNELTFNFPFYKYGIYGSTWQMFADAQDSFHSIVEKYLCKTVERVRYNLNLGEERRTVPFFEHVLCNSNRTYDEVSMLATDLIISGMDSVSHTLIFFLYLLAKNPHKQDILRAEIDQVMPKGAPCTEETLQNVPYLRACLKESLRMMPSTDGTNRMFSTDIELGGYVIPANTVIRIHGVAGLLPEFVDEPERYMPERWTRESRNKPHPYLSVPFGAGPRMCVGRRIAEQHLLTIVTKLVQNFHIRWNPELGEMSQIFRIFNAPDRPPQFTFLSRSN